MKAALPPLSLWWRRVLFGAALVAIIAFAVSSEAGYEALLRALDAVEKLAGRHGMLAASFVILFTGFAATVAFVSSWLVVPFAVYTWGAGWTLVLLMTGWLVGGAASYAIGRLAGPPVARWLGFAPVLERYEERVSRRISFSLALLFQMALPSEVRGYLFGLGHYHFGRYLVSLALAELPFAVGTVYAGKGVIQGQGLLVVALGAVLILLSAWALYLLHRRLRLTARGRRPARAEAGAPTKGDTLGLSG
jgi:uncharacterized membrane protein YdjX (TVP38/TMEM64 family)